MDTSVKTGFLASIEKIIQLGNFSKEAVDTMTVKEIKAWLDGKEEIAPEMSEAEAALVPSCFAPFYFLSQWWSKEAIINACAKIIAYNHREKIVEKTSVKELLEDTHIEGAVIKRLILNEFPELMPFRIRCHGFSMRNTKGYEFTTENGIRTRLCDLFTGNVEEIKRWNLYMLQFKPEKKDPNGKTAKDRLLELLESEHGTAYLKAVVDARERRKGEIA